MNNVNKDEIRALADAICDCYTNNKFVFICGNGGSGSNASHLCEDLGKGTITNQKRLKVISLTDNTPYILAWANDNGFDCIFVEQLKNLASPGDLLIAISGSGNSPNVLKATEWANENGLKTFGCTGFSGGKLAKLAQQVFHVKVDDMGITESVHLVAFHWIVKFVYEKMSQVL